MQCPHCHSESVIVSSPKTMRERVLSALGRHGYRCKSCSSRFFLFGSARRRQMLMERRARRIVSHAMVSRVLQHV